MTRCAPLFVVFALLACARGDLPPEAVEPLSRPITYLGDVKPVLDRRCVVCHSCYNAPCQLQLGSHEGVTRGATKQRVYDPARLEHAEPTRLFVDAQSNAEWRERGFFDVLQSQATGDQNDSILLEMLAQKRRAPAVPDTYRAEAADLQCPADRPELRGFLAKHPGRGMPFGFPELTDDEYAVFATWLQRGAFGPTAEEQAAITTPSPAAASDIAEWEAFLNAPDPKHAMTARYLYEHYFLAHVVFPGADDTQFHRLVRSRTAPGEPIVEIASTRPYDDPGVDEFWYRFRRIHDTIVLKTHMVMEFTPERLARIRTLFIEPDWVETPHRVPYGDRSAANPFVVYAQIPADSRYRFLLDNSFFLLQSFMQGPVCKGQVALNVIHDHFWVFFLDPEADRTVQVPGFLVEQADNLRLPTETGSGANVLRSFSNAYRKRYSKFYKAKVALYHELTPEGPSLDSIWRGRIADDAPALTIFRHFDSASLHRGVLGGLPRTVWVIDYSQFERIYYDLVAGFDVFGNLSHQVNVRRYMDYLRMEGELNFVSFLPRPDRLPTMKSWYVGKGAIEDVNTGEIMMDWGTRIPFETDDPKRELVELIVDDHLLPEAGIGFDDLNYRRAGHAPPPMPTRFESREQVRDGFRALTQPGTGFISHVTSFDVNVAYVRIRGMEGGDQFVSIVINRWHDNVNTMFRETKRLDPTKDTIDFVEGSVGSYPNLFFDVAFEDVGDFFDLLENFERTPEYRAKVRKYGVDRLDPRFWETYDWFQEQLDEADPMRAGLYDLNRYFPEAKAGTPETDGPTPQAASGPGSETGPS